MPAKERLQRLKAMRDERKSNNATTPAYGMSEGRGRGADDGSSGGIPSIFGSNGTPQLATSSNNGGTMNRQTPTSFASSSAAAGTTMDKQPRSGFQKGVSAPKYKKDPTPLIPVPLEGKQPDLWAKMAQQAQYDYETKVLQEKKAHAAKMEEQRRFLDAQIALRDQKRAEVRQAHLAERSVADAAHQQWVEENERKLAAKKTQIRAVGEDRAQQIDHRKARRAEEVEMLKAADQAILSNIEALNMQAKQRQADALRRKAAMKEELIAANEDLKRRIQGAREDEAAFEERIVEGMRQKEIRDHQKRVAEAEAFNEKVKGREAMAMKLQETMAQKSRADEEKAAIESKRRMAMDDERRAMQEAKKQSEKEAILAVRAYQVEERRRAKKEQEAAKERERAEIVEQYRLEREKALNELVTQRSKLAQQRSQLDAQMEEKHHYQYPLVSTEEQKINTKILAKAAKDSAHHTPLPAPQLTRDSGYKNRESSARIF